MSTERTVRSASDADVNRLLAELLGVQAKLATPVTRASAAHDAHSALPIPDSTESAIRNPQSAIFRDQIPLTAPGPGEQYAFQVDLDACSGCKACVAACHALNGLDETEAWRDVGLLVAADDTPWQQTVTTACHHCAEPGCLEGCPVVAYEKDPVTGIVRHLDDQCIGCSYCILKCPYDVPKFNARLGIVRKCDMCHQRLAVGEAPACVQACPTQAIRIVTVSASSPAPTPAPSPSSPCACGSSCGCNSAGNPSARGAARSAERQSSDPSSALPPLSGGSGFTPDIRPPSFTGSSVVSGIRSPASGFSGFTGFLPAAPDPSYTKPTTRYVSARGLPQRVRAADADGLYVQHAHWPLVVMLTLSQLAVGLLATAPLAPLPVVPDSLSQPTLAFLDSLNHLLVASGSVALPKLVTYYVTLPGEHATMLVALALLFAGLNASVLHLGKPLRSWRFFLGLRTSWLSREILVFSLFAPLAALSLLWPASVPLRVAITATGLLGVFCSAMIYIDTRRRFWRAPSTSLRFFGTTAVAALALAAPPLAAAALLAKLLAEALPLRGATLTARLQRGPLRATLGLRLGLGLAAVVAFLMAPAWIAFALFAAGELAERVLFFRSVDAPKMPGNPASA